MPARKTTPHEPGPLKHSDIGPDDVREYRTAKATTLTTVDSFGRETSWRQALDMEAAGRHFLVSRSAWSRWESGVSKPPAFVRAVIAETLNDYREAEDRINAAAARLEADA